MASSYSTNLKLELIATGEQLGTWGSATNVNLGTALEEAIAGYSTATFSSDADLTISIVNSSASQVARHFVLNVTSGVSLTATRDLIVPTIEKPYVIQNNTTGGQSITVKTAAGTGITVPNGRKAFLYVDGTNVIQMFDFVDINGGAIDGTPIGAASASTGAFTTLTSSSTTALNGTTIPASVTLVSTAATQTLTNKTISADSNTLSGIAASSFVLSNTSGNIDGAAAQKAIPAGAVVGTTDTQTLTNKTLTSPTINDGTTNLDGGTLILPQTTTPAQTAEGSVVWDTDNDLLTVGTGAARKTMVDTDSTQSLSNKTISGTFTGNITGDVTGNAATATKLATARTISLAGDVTGSVSFDGSANASITAVVVDDSHNHIISNVDGLQAALDLKAPLASPALTGTPTAPTATVGTNTTQLATTAFVNAEIANDAPTKTGTGASGTWGISITGDAASVDGKSFGTFTAAGGIVYATSTTAASGTAAGTAGQVLTSGGAGAPTWTSQSSLSVGSASSATSATNATNVAITNDTASATTHYVHIGDATSGNDGVKTSSTKLTFVPSTGDFTAGGNVTAYSDIRLKTDLRKISDALAKVNQLNGYTYTRTDTGERQTGVVAQEVQEVLPEVVIDNGVHLAVAYGNMVGLLIEAVKELTARVEKLEAN